MTDLPSLIQLADALTLAPDEDKLEAFLQAYKDLPPPANMVEDGIYVMLHDFAIEEFMETPLTCDHDEQIADK